MPNIKPISDLRNYAEVLRDVAVGAPVFLTKNGRGRYAIIDIQDYEKTKVWKPSPFVIECPYCKCFAKDVSGYVPITSYRPLFDHMSRFENQAESDCGVPVVIIKDKECAE